MAASINRVILAGNLTRDPELRNLPSGMAVCELGLAINDRIKRNGEWVEQTTFVDVTLWGKTAETANQYLRKGRPVMIEGGLRLDTWETKEGEKRSKLKVVADRMHFLDARRDDAAGTGEPRQPASSYSRPAPASAPPRNAPPAQEHYGSESDSGDDDNLPF